MIFFEFLSWYYIQAPVILWHIWRDFLIFFFNFFGFRYHARTLFRPWHALVLRYEGASRVQVFFLNLFARIVGSVIGFLVRSITLLFGTVVLLVSLIFLPVLEIAWILLPIGVVFLFARGLTLF